MSEVKSSGDNRVTRDEALERDYAEYRACFNSGRYYEAHDALEPLWLRVRAQEVANLLKGLIQLAGAFVHIQKERHGPARALLGRARFHLEPFGNGSEGVDVPAILGLIREWETRMGTAAAGDRLLTKYAPPALPGMRPG
jgi:predicted metal-dependent hydrolase